MVELTQPPPFEPASIKEIFIEAGATKLFEAAMSAMSSKNHSSLKTLQNEKKAVAIIYMVVFGQFQKANWFQKIVAQNITGRGLSETGLSILNKTGISVSKSTQRRDFIKIADSHDALVDVLNWSFEFVERDERKHAVCILLDLN